MMLLAKMLDRWFEVDITALIIYIFHCRSAIIRRIFPMFFPDRPEKREKTMKKNIVPVDFSGGRDTLYGVYANLCNKVSDKTVSKKRRISMIGFRFAICGAAALVLSLVAGCVNNEVPEDMGKLPPAIDDPNGVGTGYGLTGDGGWGPGASDASLAGQSGAAGEWTPVSPDNLGFPIVYFDYDADALLPGETAKLDEVANFLSENKELGLIVEGHCDQRGTEEYNRALCDRRANSIRSYLVGRGLEDARIRTVSYGEDRPAEQGSGESVWQKNRRGVLVPAQMN